MSTSALEVQYKGEKRQHLNVKPGENVKQILTHSEKTGFNLRQYQNYLKNS